MFGRFFVGFCFGAAAVCAGIFVGCPEGRSGNGDRHALVRGRRVVAVVEGRGYVGRGVSTVGEISVDRRGSSPFHDRQLVFLAQGRKGGGTGETEEFGQVKLQCV